MDRDFCLLPTSPIPSWRVGPLKLPVGNTFICRVYFRAPGKTEPTSPGLWWSLSVQAPASGLCSVGGISQFIVYLNEAKNSKWVVAAEYTANRKWPLYCAQHHRLMNFSKCFLTIAMLKKRLPLKERVGLCWQGPETCKWEKLFGLWALVLLIFHMWDGRWRLSKQFCHADRAFKGSSPLGITGMWGNICARPTASFPHLQVQNPDGKQDEVEKVRQSALFRWCAGLTEFSVEL